MLIFPLEKLHNTCTSQGLCVCVENIFAKGVTQRKISLNNSQKLLVLLCDYLKTGMHMFKPFDATQSSSWDRFLSSRVRKHLLSSSLLSLEHRPPPPHYTYKHTPHNSSHPHNHTAHPPTLPTNSPPTHCTSTLTFTVHLRSLGF